LVRTKADLATTPCLATSTTCPTSAATGAGLDRLKAVVGDRLADRAVHLAADAIALGGRHQTALAGASAALSDALELVEPQGSARALADAELIAASMRVALDEVGAVAGNLDVDEVLGRIFARFCIGK
jgi:tRNA modification GTPase